MKKRILALILTVSMLFPLVACSNDTDTTQKSSEPVDSSIQSSDSETNAPTKSSSITLKDTCVYMFVGSSHALKYELDKTDSSNQEIAWSTSSDSVTVNNGIVFAKKEGYAYVSANSSNKCLICVIPQNMPIMSVDTNNQAINSKDVYTNCTISLKTDTSRYSFSNAAAGIRIRGNSTSTYDKKPYRIKFESKRNLLGMNSGNEYKSWVLLAEWLDDSMLRNTVSFSLASMMLGEYSSDWRYVSLHINGQFAGVYVLCEQTQINKGRINIQEAGLENTALMSGYLFEVDASTAYDSSSMFKIYHSDYDITDLEGEEYTWTCNDNKEKLQYISLENDVFSNDQLLFTKYYVRAVFDIIYNATYKNKAYVFKYDFLSDPSKAEAFLSDCSNGNNFKNGIVETTALTPREAIESVIDIDSLARMYIFSETICNSDDLKKSFYFWVDFSEGGTKKLTFGSPWDHDGAIVDWPNLSKDYKYQPTNKYFAAKRNPWYVMIMCNKWFVQEVNEQWQDLYEKNNGYRAVIDLIPKISANYQSEFEQEYQRWSYWRTNNYSNEAEKTRLWLKDRIEWMNYKFGKK